MRAHKTGRVDRLFAEGTPIDAALLKAADEAFLFHQRLGETVPVWRDGRTVWMTMEEVAALRAQAEPSSRSRRKRVG